MEHQTLTEFLSKDQSKDISEKVLSALKDTKRHKPVFEGSSAEFPGKAEEQKIIFFKIDDVWYFAFKMAASLEKNNCK